MYRLAIVLALLALPVAGCGGGSDDGAGSKGPASAVAKAPANQSDGRAKAAQERARKGALERAKRDRKAAREKRESADEKASVEKQQESGEAKPAEDFAALIEQAARGTLALFGLGYAGVEISDAGRSVNVLVTRASACKAIARDESAMAARIRKAAEMVRTVRFEVAGTNKELGYYILDCEREKIPDGPGVTVLERTGVGGPAITKTVRVGKHWAIEWENVGNYLGVVVVGKGKSEGDYFAPISSQQRETGRKLYKGPATIELQISGGGLWTVRVKDIR